MADAKKIYDYPVETSIQYAQSKALFDEKLISESTHVAYQTTMEVTRPSYLAEFDNLFETRKFIQWADFNIPEKYNTQAKSDLFTHSLLMPSLGPSELKEVKKDAVAAQTDTFRAQLSEVPGEEFEKKQTLKQNVDSGEKLLALFQAIEPRDRDLADIGARKNQYVAA